MNGLSEAQFGFITDLANRILAVDLDVLPTKQMAPAGFTFNPQANAKASQVIAREALDKLAAGRIGARAGTGVFGASQIIDGLKMAARRAGC